MSDHDYTLTEAEHDRAKHAAMQAACHASALLRIARHHLDLLNAASKAQRTPPLVSDMIAEIDDMHTTLDTIMDARGDMIAAFPLAERAA